MRDHLGGRRHCTVLAFEFYIGHELYLYLAICNLTVSRRIASVGLLEKTVWGCGHAIFQWEGSEPATQLEEIFKGLRLTAGRRPSNLGSMLGLCWPIFTLIFNTASKKKRKLQVLQSGGVDTGWVGGRGRSAYNLRLPPKASGKDTGSVAGARIKGLPLPAANPWVTRESWSKWLNTTVLGPLHDSKTLASQHRKTMELKDGRGLSTDSCQCQTSLSDANRIKLQILTCKSSKPWPRSTETRRFLTWTYRSPRPWPRSTETPWN